MTNYVSHPPKISNHFYPHSLHLFALSPNQKKLYLNTHVHHQEPQLSTVTVPIAATKDKPGVLVNSLTPKSVMAATENSSSEGFWLAKHNHTNIPTMMEPFPPPAAWF
jgi:hypothetical protein